MGFFLDEKAAAVVEATPKARAPGGAKAKRAVVEAGARGCMACPLQTTWATIATPRMPTTGESAADILVLGEAPGETEDVRGKQFVGESGTTLRGVIPRREWDRLAWQNAVRCRPPSNRTPTPQETYACSMYLEEDVERLKLKAILGVGGVPLARFWPNGKATITQVHGVRFPIKIGSRALWYCPVLHPSFVNRMGGARSPGYATLRSDVRNFFRDVDAWGRPTITQWNPQAVLLPRSREDAEAILARMQRPVGVDIETNETLRPFERDARIICAAFSDGNVTMAFPMDYDWGLDFLLATTSAVPWIAHNANFELMWFKWTSRSIWGYYEAAPFDDTMALARLYFERTSMNSLEMMTHALFGANVKDAAGVNARRIMAYPMEQVLPYCGLDAEASAKAYWRLKREVNPDHYKRLLNSIESTTEMEIRGLPMDLDVSRQLKDEFSAKVKHGTESAARIYEVRQFELTTQQQFNIASDKHVLSAFRDHGNIPIASTGDDVLKEACPDHPLTKIVLDYRTNAIMLATFIEPMLAAPKLNSDGLLHPSYTVLHTRTGRLSSENPSIQNIPKRKHREIRRQVVAPPGHLILAFDFGQMEARILAMASMCKTLIKAFLQGYDIHMDWVEAVLEAYPEYWQRLMEQSGETEEKRIKKAGRTTIKSDFVFASFYGAYAGTCAARTGIPLPIMESLQKRLWKRFPEIPVWHTKMRRFYEDTGTSVTLTGRVRREILNGNEPINNPIQGTMADVVSDCRNELAALSREMNEPTLHPRIDIHDDLTFILRDDETLVPYIGMIASVMTKLRYDWQIVPFIAEANVGPNWCDLEEFNVFRGDYHK